MRVSERFGNSASFEVVARQYFSRIGANGQAPYRTDYHMPRRVLTFALDSS